MDPDRVKGTVKNTLGQGETFVGEAVGSNRMQADGLADRVAGAAQNAYGRAKDAARDAARDAVDRAPEAWNEAVEASHDYARRGASVMRDRMNDQPIAGLLLAGAIGYLLGWAIHGRN